MIPRDPKEKRPAISDFPAAIEEAHGRVEDDPIREEDRFDADLDDKAPSGDGGMDDDAYFYD